MNKKFKTYYLMLSKVFPKGHPKEGQPTHFKEKFLSGEKVHTIRTNVALWEQRIAEVRRGEAVLSIRQWSGKPYEKGSSQIEIGRLTASDGISTQRCSLDASRFVHMVGAEGYIYTVAHDTVAKNDGLSVSDFLAWFDGYPHSKDLVCIHFNSLIY